jgi:hypothetical protein
LTFFSYKSSTSEKVSWTGFEIAKSLLTGSTTKSIPPTRYPVDTTADWFGVWEPIYIVSFVAAYSCMLICGIAAAIQPLRRILRLAGPVGAMAASFCVGKGGSYVFRDAPQLRAGIGPLMLTLVLVTLLLVAEADVAPD